MDLRSKIQVLLSASVKRGRPSGWEIPLSHVCLLLRPGSPGLGTLPITVGCNSTSLSDEKARK